MGLTLSGIARHPVKSCAGEAMADAVVASCGLAGDRRWMLIDADGECATAREHHTLLLAQPELVDGGLTVRGPGAADLFVTEPDGPAVGVTVHGRGPYPATLADPSAHDWFSALAGAPLRLVFQPDPTTRPANPRFSLSLIHI